MTELKRRASDTEILDLIARVEQLDTDVRKLRHDFEDHTKDEALKIELLNATLISIQVKLDQLLLDIAAPIEAYKTAQGGFRFMKFIGETLKWFVPLCIGIAAGVNLIK